MCLVLGISCPLHYELALHDLRVEYYSGYADIIGCWYAKLLDTSCCMMDPRSMYS